jgi:MFS family permease
MRPDQDNPQNSRGWTVIVAYALVCAATQLLWLTYAAITTETARHYGVSMSAVGWLAEIFPLLYVVLAVPAGILLDRWFRRSLAAGGALVAMGGLMRLGGDTFAWAMGGQIVVAVAQHARGAVGALGVPVGGRDRSSERDPLHGGGSADGERDAIVHATVAVAGVASGPPRAGRDERNHDETVTLCRVLQRGRL